MAAPSTVTGITASDILLTDSTLQQPAETACFQPDIHLPASKAFSASSR